jgi:hypothetical protein
MSKTKESERDRQKEGSDFPSDKVKVKLFAQVNTRGGLTEYQGQHKRE